MNAKPRFEDSRAGRILFAAVMLAAAAGAAVQFYLVATGRR